MRKIIFSILMVLMVMYGNAQFTVYAKFTLYNGGSLVDENAGNSHTGQILLGSYSDSEEQTLNIGSQSTGAGAGKIIFSPLMFSKPVSINSPQFSSMMASGTAFQKAEFSFYSNGKLVFMRTLGLVAFKSIARSVWPCTPACPPLIETISMEYGSAVNTFYPDSKGQPVKPVSAGWNRVKNVSITEPGSL